MEHKDVYLLETIRDYCDDLLGAIKEYDVDEAKVKTDAGIRGMVAFFVIQIGEMTKSLSAQFKAAHPEIEWDMIVGFRNHIVHEYGDVIPDILWDAVERDIPALREFCAEQIN